MFDRVAPLTIQFHRVQVLQRESRLPLGEYLVTAWRIPEKSHVGWIVETGD